jgi:tRNA(Arg) A34 adenosine deaminase TadA
MCLAAMYYCSPDRVVFVTTREDYSRFYSDHRKYFTLSNFYGEIAKPWQERAMPMVHERNPGAIEVYRRWREKNG